MPLVSWLKGYLCDRRARGKRLNCVGRSYVLACGLPQGSSPSTLLWNIYTHDLDFSIPDNHGCGANLVQTGFADDQSFHAIGGSWEEVFELLQAAATKLENYCNIWRIQLNAKKCQLLLFGRRPASSPNITVSIQGEAVQETSAYKFLGVWFDTDSNLNIVEVVRNEGLRTASGLPRSTKVTTLRTLTGTLPLRTLGEARAAKLFDHALRLPQTPIYASASICVPCPKSLASTPRAAGARYLALNGLLAYPRALFPKPLMADIPAGSFSVLLTATSKTDSPAQQKASAEQLLISIRTKHAGRTELWTDGSLSATPEAWQKELVHGERVAVEFSGGWYFGTVVQPALEPLRKSFLQRHGTPPAFQISFDDQTSHAYKIIRAKTMAALEVVDEDSTTDIQILSRNIPSTIGGACIYISSPGTENLQLSLPLGATFSSYDAEVAAATFVISHSRDL